MYGQHNCMDNMPTWQFQGNQQPNIPGAMPLSRSPFSQPGVMGQMEMDQLPIEQSYIENILRLNKGKLATVYMSFNDEEKVFTGIVEAAGRDHIILSDPETGMRYLLLMVYLNYVTFEEEIEYRHPFGQMATYSPR